MLDIKALDIRTILRYCVATVLASITLFISSRFVDDNVAAVGLFSTIIVVIGEDISLGPVIYKSLFRSSGVLIGGVSGLLLLYFPSKLFPSDPCLIIIPIAFVGLVQILTKGGSSTITAFIKKKKASHLVIQLQIAFGVVYIGSWNNPQNGLKAGINRTVAILLGCTILLLTSFIIYPVTSLYASAEELCICLRTSSKLLHITCKDRCDGITLPPYNHKARIFGWDITDIEPDPHMTLLDKLDAKLARILSLQPFLYIEPTWVPGLPVYLLSKYI